MKALALMFFASVAPPAIGQTIALSQPAAASPFVESQQDPAKPTAKISPEKEAAIRKLLEAAGTRANMEKVMAAMMDNMKPTISKMLPPGEYQGKLINLFFERLQSKVKVDELLDLAVPIYDKYLSKEDIEALTQFYQTPLGKKVLSVLPQVMIELQTAGMNLGQEAGRQSMLEVLNEHPDLAKAMQDAAAQKN